MTTYVKRDIQRAFDYLKIATDDMYDTGHKLEQKAIDKQGDNISDRYRLRAQRIFEARDLAMQAVEKLAEANSI